MRQSRIIKYLQRPFIELQLFYYAAKPHNKIIAILRTVVNMKTSFDVDKTSISKLSTMCYSTVHVGMKNT